IMVSPGIAQSAPELIDPNVTTKKSTGGTQNMKNTQQQRSPIATFKNGFTTEQLKEYRTNYNLPYLLSGGDA
ncbi:MAG: hypothetical protein V7782_15825, partial [Psychromonas sp.]